MERSGSKNNGRPQRRMSFNYKWDVQQQSACVSFTSFGLTFKRPLDLLDESFERSDQSAPVSLIHLSQGQVFARQDVSDDRQHQPKVMTSLEIDRTTKNRSIGEFFCPKLTRGQSVRKRTEADPLDFPLASSSYVDSGTVRLTDKRRFDPLLLEDYADQQYWQRKRQFPILHHDRPLPSLPDPRLLLGATADGGQDSHEHFDDAQDRDDDEEEEYFHSCHLSLVVIVYLAYPFRPAASLYNIRDIVDCCRQHSKNVTAKNIMIFFFFFLSRKVYDSKTNGAIYLGMCFSLFLQNVFYVPSANIRLMTTFSVYIN